MVEISCHKTVIYQGWSFALSHIHYRRREVNVGLYFYKWLLEVTVSWRIHCRDLAEWHKKHDPLKGMLEIGPEGLKVKGAYLNGARSVRKAIEEHVQCLIP